MKIITYQIELLQPVLVTSLQGDPNSDVAFDYLPGSVLRGAIIGRYLRQNGLSELDTGDENSVARRLFFNGRARYLNAYPLAEKTRTLPVPHTWQRKKETETPIYDFAIEEKDEEDWKGVDNPFWLAVSDKVCLIKPERHIAVHIARDRHLGQADNDTIQRAVYRYDALAAGQSFAAIILCEDDDLADLLLPLLSDRYSIGGSRSGGYGRVRIVNAQFVGDTAVWRETSGELAEQDKLRITLLSDSLLRDNNGQLAVNRAVVTQAVAQALGVAGLTCQDAFFAAEAVGGFNRTWGLPLPQAKAVAMGSVFVFDHPGCSLEKLRALEQSGLGERRAEGFGRVAVNWLAEPEWSVEPESDRYNRETAPVTIPAESKAAEIAGQIAARLLRQQIESQIEQKAHQLGAHIKGVKRSQLSRLRLLFQDALYQEQETGQSQLQIYLRGLHERKVTRSQFDRARVGSEPLLSWLEKRVNGADGIWGELGIQAGRVKIGGIAADLTAELAYEYNLRLAEAVLARATKEKEETR